MVQKISTETPVAEKNDPFDRLLGHFGRWQFIVCATLSLVKLSSGWVQMAILFLTPNLTFWCSNMTSDFTTSDGLNGTFVDVQNNTCYNDCQSYEYDASPFENTIISEWDLVCERRWLASFTQMVLQLGVLLGSIIFGFLSDRYGRKYTFLASCVAVIGLGFAIPFSPNYFVFTGLRFLLGLATAGTMVVSFVMLMETVGVKYRGVVGCMYQLPFIIGHMTVPLFAYYYRSWDQYTLALAIPPLIYLGYFFVLSESPRWLVSVGRVEQATGIVKKAAVMNRLPTSKIEETLNALSSEIIAASRDEAEQKRNYSDLFSPSLRVTTVCFCLIWLIAGVTYFGFNQFISQTSPDPFISVAAAGAIQIPSNFLSMWLIAQFGRKMTTISFLVLGGILIITLGCVPHTFYLVLTLGTLGVSCASIVATTIYIYTSEMYPTVVRNMGLGVCSMSMRIGSMLAPFISDLSVTIPWLPTVILGLAPIGAALVCLCLPETKGRTLPDSMQDVKSEK